MLSSVQISNIEECHTNLLALKVYDSIGESQDWTCECECECEFAYNQFTNGMEWKKGNSKLYQ